MKTNTSNIRKVNGGYIVETLKPASTVVENVCTDFDSLVTFLRGYYKVRDPYVNVDSAKPADTLKDAIEPDIEFAELDDGLVATPTD